MKENDSDAAGGMAAALPGWVEQLLLFLTEIAAPGAGLPSRCDRLSDATTPAPNTHLFSNPVSSLFHPSDALARGPALSISSSEANAPQSQACPCMSVALKAFLLARICRPLAWHRDTVHVGIVTQTLQARWVECPGFHMSSAAALNHRLAKASGIGAVAAGYSGGQVALPAGSGGIRHQARPVQHCDVVPNLSTGSSIPQCI